MFSELLAEGRVTDATKQRSYLNIITADREAFFSFFSDPDKFSAAAPYVFLFASLLILIFGPGKLCVDALLRRFAHIPPLVEAASFNT